MASQQGAARATKSPYAVFLYYPNLIGYARIGFVLASYYIANQNWQLSTLFYVLAFAGDVVDGAVARKFNQSSSFGATLDMVTDRCSTAGMLFVLAEFFYICMYLLAFNPKAELTITDGVTVSLWQVTYIVCMPACICKQAVNVAQLCAAAYSMAESDVAVKTA
eukprot:12512-Heterococcus_DN1.PRE.1